MGFALAEALAGEGATVSLVTGPTAYTCATPGVTVRNVESAEQMLDACSAVFPQVQGAILAAAVADFRPKYQYPHKIKKQAQQPFHLELEPTPDILAHLGNQKTSGQLLVGFSLETENAQTNAKTKLRNKNLDLVVLNQLNHDRTNFGEGELAVTLIDRNERVTAYSAQPKSQVAITVVAHLKQLTPVVNP